MTVRENLFLSKLSCRWTVAVFCFVASAAMGAPESTYHSRNLNPYHRRQIDAEIAQMESQISGAKDIKTKGELQQELCKKLIQAEEYDKALRMANDVYLDAAHDKERRAAHHYLIADIYARKMKASPTDALMKQNRSLAYQSAQSVVNQNYPAKWGAGELAKKLLTDLQDPKYMGNVQEWVQKRSSNGCDVNQVNLARSQRNALETGAGGRASGLASRGFSAARKTGSSLFGIFGNNGSANQQVVTQSQPAVSWGRQGSANAAAQTQNPAAASWNIPGAGQVTYSQAKQAQSALFDQRSPVLPASASPRAPIIIDGNTVRRTSPISSATNESKLSTLAETYANGQAPRPSVIKN